MGFFRFFWIFLTFLYLLRFLNCFELVWIFFKLLRLLLKVTEVTTDHQKLPNGPKYVYRGLDPSIFGWHHMWTAPYFTKKKCWSPILLVSSWLFLASNFYQQLKVQLHILVVFFLPLALLESLVICGGGELQIIAKLKFFWTIS